MRTGDGVADGAAVFSVLMALKCSYVCSYIRSRLLFDFEWDANKARSNIAMHGIDFRVAIRVFDGPYLMEEGDGPW